MKRTLSLFLALIMVLGIGQNVYASPGEDSGSQAMDLSETMERPGKPEPSEQAPAVNKWEVSEKVEDPAASDPAEKSEEAGLLEDGKEDGELEMGPERVEEGLSASPAGEKTRYDINSREDFIQLLNKTGYYSGFGRASYVPAPGYREGDAWHHGVKNYDIYLNADIQVSSDEIFAPIEKNKHNPKFNFGFGLEGSNFFGNGHTITFTKGEKRPIYPLFGEIKNYSDKGETCFIKDLNIVYDGDVTGSAFAKNIYGGEKKGFVNYNIENIRITVNGSILPYADLSADVQFSIREDRDALIAQHQGLNSFSPTDTTNYAVGMANCLDGANVSNYSLQVKGNIGSKEVVRNKYAITDRVHARTAGLFLGYAIRPAEVVVYKLSDISVNVGGGLYAHSNHYWAEASGIGNDLQRKKFYNINLDVGKDIYAEASGKSLYSKTSGDIYRASFASGVGYELHHLDGAKIRVAGDIKSINHTDIEVNTLAAGISKYDYIHEYKEDGDSPDSIKKNPLTIKNVNLTVGGDIYAESTENLKHRPPLLSGREADIGTEAVAGSINSMESGLRLYDDFSNNTLKVEGDIIAKSNYGDKLKSSYSFAGFWGYFEGNNNEFSARSIQAISPRNMAIGAPFLHFLKGEGNKVTLTEGVVIDSAEDSGGTLASNVTQYDGSKNTLNVPGLTCSNPFLVGGLAGQLTLHKNHRDPKITEGAKAYVPAKISHVHIEPEINIKSAETSLARENVYLGGFVGINSGIIENSSTKPKKKLSLQSDKAKYFGGFVGFNGQKGSIINASSELKGIELKGAGNSYVGGFVGWNSGNIGQEDMGSSGASMKVGRITVTSLATTNNIGGFVGQSQGQIFNSSACIGEIGVDAGAKNMNVSGFAAYGNGDTIKNSSAFIHDSIKTKNSSNANVGGFRGIAFDSTDHDNASQVGENIELAGNKGPVTVGGYAGKIQAYSGKLNPEVFRSTALVFGNIIGQSDAELAPNKLSNVTSGFIGVSQGKTFKDASGSTGVRPVDIFHSASYVGGKVISQYPNKNTISGAVGILFASRLRGFTVLSYPTDQSEQNVITPNNYLEGMAYSEFKDDKNFYVEVNEGKRRAYPVYLSDQADGSQSFDIREKAMGEIVIDHRSFQEDYWGDKASKENAKLPYENFSYLLENKGGVQFTKLLRDKEVYKEDLSRASLKTYCGRHAAIWDEANGPIYDILGIPGKAKLPDKPDKPDKPHQPDKPVTPRPQDPKEVERIGGKDRDETAEKISKRFFDRAKYAIVARNDNYPDALTASLLAKLLDCPILLNNPSRLEEGVKNEIKRLGANEIILVGGDDALSRRVKSELDELDRDQAERIGGSDRYETSALIAKRVEGLLGKLNKAIIASGENYPDALASAPLAAKENAPILLSKQAELPKAVDRAIKDLGIRAVYISGGQKAVGKQVEQVLPKLILRFDGMNRYETAVLIARELTNAPSYVFLASGENFPDALTIGPVAAKRQEPILLTHKATLTKESKDYLSGRSIKKLFVIGGNDAIEEGVIGEYLKANE